MSGALVPNYTIMILCTEYTMLYPWTLALYYHDVTEINQDGDESSVVDRPGDYMDTLLGVTVFMCVFIGLLGVTCWFIETFEYLALFI